MKKTITILAIILTISFVNSQTTINSSVSLAVDSHLVNDAFTQYVQPHQNGCGGILNGDITINGDLNLNGRILYLKQNTILQINGNFNGPGSIQLCNNGNNTQSISFCVNGAIQNNPTFNNIQCNPTLSNPTFNYITDLDYNYIIYDLSGRNIQNGKTNPNMYEALNKGIYIVHVEGFKIKKESIR